jgi:hypothetical protein
LEVVSWIFNNSSALTFLSSLFCLSLTVFVGRKSTKQLATLGPASSNREMIEKLFLAGADCFRLNFSHGSQEQKKELLMTIREIEEKYSHPIGILGDLQGPKLRVRHRSQNMYTGDWSWTVIRLDNASPYFFFHFI